MQLNGNIWHIAEDGYNYENFIYGYAGYSGGIA